MMNVQDLRLLLDSVREAFLLGNESEATLEANPGTLNPGLLLSAKASGFNRISLGVQSFDNGILGSLGRAHTEAQAVDSFGMAREAGFDNISLDLIFGLPGQSMKQWHQSLEQAIGLSPEHVSIYGLQLEEGTPLYQDYKCGRVPEVSVKLEREMYHEGAQILRNSGYGRYEISNFSKPGKECRHNLKYWTMGEFLGLGLGASSYIQGKRWQNLKYMDEWKACIEAGELPVDKNTLLSDSRNDEASILVFTGLRTQHGISFSQFEKITGLHFNKFYPWAQEMLDEWKEKNWIRYPVNPEEGFSLTDEGIDRSNEIMAEFV